MKFKKVKVENLVTKSSLEGYQGVINSYIGCEFGCKFCCGSFISRFTNHTNDKWGSFADIKTWTGRIKIVENIFISSVTDPYQPCEEKYQITRKALEELIYKNPKITISTRSDLVLRDIDLLKKLNAKVIVSVCTSNEKLQKLEGKTPSFEKRINVLKKLHENGIYTILAISPMLPYFCEYEKIIKLSKDFVNEYIFENLKLKHPFKTPVLNFIETYFKEYYEEYRNIYVFQTSNYWSKIKNEIKNYCEVNKLNAIIDIE